MYSGKTNKFILVSLDRYLIFDINGDLLKKIINNNLSNEITQNDICSPINNYPFVICWHLAKVSFSESESSLRGKNSIKSSLSSISLNNSNDNDNNIFMNYKNKNYEIRNLNREISNLGELSPILDDINERNNIDDNNSSSNLYSPLSSKNPNNIGFYENSDIFKDKFSIEGLNSEHQIDIVYMDNVNYIMSINFKIDYIQKIISVNYIQETNSVFIITCFGEIYEIKL